MDSNASHSRPVVAQDWAIDSSVGTGDFSSPETNKCHPLVPFRPHGCNRGAFSPIYEISAADSAENSDSTLDHFSGLAILEIFGNNSRRRVHLGLGLGLAG
jgi:hypothetical protein